MRRLGRIGIFSETIYKFMANLKRQHPAFFDNDTDNPVLIKKPKKVASDSLQNPSDPDASYSGHKGQGYQVQIMETYSPCDNPEEKPLNLIAHVHVEQAHQSCEF